jgi:DNA-binding transcriptional LysR family regulator
MDYLAAIRLFVRAVELGSFSKAAADCGAKVSSVSRAVAALEADLGVALFNRSTRRLNPTEAGGDFYERSVRILAEVEDARAQTAALNGKPQGLLKINLPGAFGRRHVVPLLPAFLAAYPDIRIEATLTDATVNLIEVGADVAIRIGALPDSTLIAKKLAPHRRVLCAGPAYLAGRVLPMVPADIARENCLLFALAPADRWFFTREGERAEVAVKGSFRANDSEALLDVAESGLGIALLPTWIAGAAVRQGRLVPLLPDWEVGLAPGDRAIWGVYPPKKILSPKVRAFLDFIEAGFGRPAVWDR